MAASVVFNGWGGVGQTKVGGKVGGKVELKLNVQQVIMSCDHVHT